MSNPAVLADEVVAQEGVADEMGRLTHPFADTDVGIGLAIVGGKQLCVRVREMEECDVAAEVVKIVETADARGVGVS